MTRIIAGAAGSLTLSVPKSGTRPTSDRVREAMFSALDSRIEWDEQVVLDLYAGSGALGLEAASRGATRVTLVEKGKPAAAVCRANAKLVAARCSPAPKIDVRASSVASFLATAPQHPDATLVFSDPPYDLSPETIDDDLQMLRDHLADYALVLVERSTRSREPQWPAGFELVKKLTHGETTTWLVDFARS